MKRMLIAALPLLLAACAKPPQKPDAMATVEQATPAAAEPAAIDTGVLTGYHWQLNGATDAQGKRIDALFVRADKPLTLDFRQGRLGIGNSCNQMGGAYEFNGHRLAIGKLASTMKACPDPALMALDEAIGTRLNGHLSAQLQQAPEQLTLTTASGDTLVFAGVPTAETRYGGPGERAFLEVAAQTKPCSHPLMPNMQCLQVRELHYDDKGLKTGTPGEFQNFYQQIEGYTHEPGVRNVLRVKRYTLANPPADASRFAYVLDMVVESAIEKP